MSDIQNSIFPIVAKLKKQYIHIKNLQKGDFVVTGDIFWEVDKIFQENHGFFTALDNKDNGFVMSPGDEIVVIVNRNCFGT